MNQEDFEEFKKKMKKAASMDTDKIHAEVAKAMDNMFVYLYNDQDRPADLKRGLMLACLMEYQNLLHEKIRELRKEGVENIKIESLKYVSQATFLRDLLDSLGLEEIPGIKQEPIK